MDRQTIYSGQLPRSLDQLQQSQNAMVALAKLSAAVLGTSALASGSGANIGAIVNGFTCTPTTPASLSVIVTPGEIYQLANLEATTWSAVSADTTHSILKQGILLDPVTFGITPPGTVGFSQCFLIEVQYSDQDTGSIVIPYFNATNPSVPYSGPGNAGTAQNTVRKGIAAVQVKAGVAAATGSQIIPSPDAGWVGLFVVTVANGAATITSGNITTYASAPFIPTALPNVPATLQSGAWTYGGTTSNSGSAFSCTLNPVPAALTVGMVITLKMNVAPVGASTLNVNALGAQSMVGRGGRAIQANDWNANDFISWEWTGSSWMACSFLVGDIGGGVPLHANTTFYVNASTGSDTLYDGTSSVVSGIHGPFATLQRAMTVITQFNLNGFNITVNVANGTYAGLNLQAVSGSGNVNWVGTSNTSTIISGSSISAITAGYCGRAHTFNNFYLQASGTYTGDPMIGIHAFGSGTSVSHSNMTFGSCPGGHMSAEQGATMIVAGNYNVSGGCAGSTGGNGAHANVASSGQIQSPAAVTCTVTTAVNFAAGWIVAGNLGFLQILYSSISGGGAVTGQRYNVSANAVVATNGGGATYYPGNSAGATSSGGQYL